MSFKVSKEDMTLLMELFPILLCVIHITLVMTKVLRNSAKERKDDEDKRNSKKQQKPQKRSIF